MDPVPEVDEAEPAKELENDKDKLEVLDDSVGT